MTVRGRIIRRDGTRGGLLGRRIRSGRHAIRVGLALCRRLGEYLGNLYRATSARAGGIVHYANPDGGQVEAYLDGPPAGKHVSAAGTVGRPGDS